MRVTDLENFSLEEIWRPYQTMLGYERRLDTPPCNLEGTAVLLIKEQEWSHCVIGRLKAIGITFPTYINHPLVWVVNTLIELHTEGE